jgi:hypothetical protein
MQHVPLDHPVGHDRRSPTPSLHFLRRQRQAICQDNVIIEQDGYPAGEPHDPAL